MVQYRSITFKYPVINKALIYAFIVSIALILLAIWFMDVSSHRFPISYSNYSDHLKPDILVESASISLCVIIRVHSGHFSYLPVLALALNHTGFEKIHLYVINIDRRIDNQWFRGTIDMINTIVRRTNYTTLLDVGVSENNDFGYNLTDRALAYLYNQYEHSPSACHYVIFTNGDNFYSRDLGKNIITHMFAKKDIIAWDFVSHYHWSPSKTVYKISDHGLPNIVDTGTAKCMPVALRKEHADLGSAAYRLAFLKQHGLKFHYLNRNYYPGSDGFFIETAAGLTNASIILRQVLYVHQ